MALQDNTTYKLHGQDAVHINGRFYDPARMTRVIAQLKDLKQGDVTTIGGQPVDLPRRIIPDDHDMPVCYSHGSNA